MGLCLGVEFPFDHDVAGGERRIDITLGERLLGEDVMIEAAVKYLEIVGKLHG